LSLENLTKSLTELEVMQVMKIGDTIKYSPLGYREIDCEVMSIIPFGNFTILDLRDKEFGTMFEGILLTDKKTGEENGEMKNVTLEVKGNTLTITVNLDKTFGPSNSKKTTIVASTEGNIGVPGHEQIRLGLNVYK